MLQGEVGGDTLAEYMQLEEKIARMETNRYKIPISIMVVVEEDPAVSVSYFWYQIIFFVLLLYLHWYLEELINWLKNYKYMAIEKKVVHDETKDWYKPLKDIFSIPNQSVYI